MIDFFSTAGGAKAVKEGGRGMLSNRGEGNIRIVIAGDDMGRFNGSSM